MTLNAAFNPNQERRESLADRLFSFIGLMAVCFGLLVTYSAARFLWHEWQAGNPNDIMRWHMIAVIRWQLLAGIVWLTAGGFLLGKRWVVAGLLLFLGALVFLGAGGDR